MTGEQFAEARNALGLTQEALAREWSMGPHGARTIRRWELGEVPVNTIADYAIGLMVMQRGA